jgi:hypothetical protein
MLQRPGPIAWVEGVRTPHEFGADTRCRGQTALDPGVVQSQCQGHDPPPFARREAAFLLWQFNVFQGLFGRAPTLIIEVGRGYHIS